MSGNSECQFYVWAIIAALILALIISLIFNVSHYVEKQQQDGDNLSADGKIHSYFDDFIPRENEYYVEDIPIYGNLDNVVPEPMDENCYEQMKARPERSGNELQGATLTAQATEMCYASLNHNCKGKRGKPRKQNAYLSDKSEDEPSCGINTSFSTTSLVDSFPPENQAMEENIHDDPIRLFGLIRAKTEPLS